MSYFPWEKKLFSSPLQEFAADPQSVVWQTKFWKSPWKIPKINLESTCEDWKVEPQKLSERAPWTRLQLLLLMTCANSRDLVSQLIFTRLSGCMTASHHRGGLTAKIFGSPGLPHLLGNFPLALMNPVKSSAACCCFNIEVNGCKNISNPIVFPEW